MATHESGHFLRGREALILYKIYILSCNEKCTVIIYLINAYLNYSGYIKMYLFSKILQSWN